MEKCNSHVTRKKTQMIKLGLRDWLTSYFASVCYMPCCVINRTVKKLFRTPATSLHMHVQFVNIYAFKFKSDELLVLN